MVIESTGKEIIHYRRSEKCTVHSFAIRDEPCTEISTNCHVKTEKNVRSIEY